MLFLALEIAISKGWSRIWLETDSVPVLKNFLSSSLENCLYMEKLRSHICIEGNDHECADRIAAHGSALDDFLLSDSLPSFCKEAFYINRFRLPN